MILNLDQWDVQISPSREGGMEALANARVPCSRQLLYPPSPEIVLHAALQLPLRPLS